MTIETNPKTDSFNECSGGSPPHVVLRDGSDRFKKPKKLGESRLDRANISCGLSHDEQRESGYHEAGHVVVADVYGYAVQSVTIQPKIIRFQKQKVYVFRLHSGRVVLPGSPAATRR
jgi:hypothetical protein